jgi:hypothetical protein
MVNNIKCDIKRKKLNTITSLVNNSPGNNRQCVISKQIEITGVINEYHVKISGVIFKPIKMSRCDF